MPGPRRTPTAILALRGSWRAKVRARTEPAPPPLTSADPPDWLRGEIARAEWRRIAPLLIGQGLLTAWDTTLLGGYCANYGRWAECETAINAQGVIVRGPHGGAIKNPFWPVAQEALKQMRAFGAEFGLSPATRLEAPTSQAPALAIAKRTRS